MSTTTVYQALRARARAWPLRRTDAGVPRILPPAALARYCELMGLKVRTRHTQGRQLSTPEALRRFEDYGIAPPAFPLIANGPFGKPPRSGGPNGSKPWR